MGQRNSCVYSSLVHVFPFTTDVLDLMAHLLSLVTQSICSGLCSMCSGPVGPVTHGFSSCQTLLAAKGHLYRSVLLNITMLG